MELILTGAAFDASQAQTWGLVSRVAPPGSALAHARELAAAIATNGPMAVRASKYLVTQSDEWTLKESFPKQREIVGQVMASGDAKEGATAFAEKRAPVWTGR
jgi:enoyl-CoA hydratase/carnithine racemase